MSKNRSSYRFVIERIDGVYYICRVKKTTWFFGLLNLLSKEYYKGNYYGSNQWGSLSAGIRRLSLQSAKRLFYSNEHEFYRQISEDRIFELHETEENLIKGELSVEDKTERFIDKLKQKNNIDE